MDNNQIPENNTKFFCIVRWCEEDIEEALRQYGYDPSPEMVAIIRRNCEHHCFREAMIETGRDYINAYISENESALEAAGGSSR